MKIISSSVIYENPLPQLQARQSLFPSLCELDDGTVLACHAIGQAMESVDQTSCISRSADGGKSWSPPVPMFDRDREGFPVSDVCKITNAGDGRLIGIGYQFLRKDPSLPIGNPATGGLLEDRVFFTESRDGGFSWIPPKPVDTAWNGHTEASAPITVLANGDWAAPITGFPAWDGTMTGPRCGRLLRSRDQGTHWDDRTVCMSFPGRAVTCYEQRLCRLRKSGTLVVIGWNEDTGTGRALPNHYTLSADNGRTFSAPASTGINGQAASVCAVGDDRLLALHAVRRDTDAPGIYGCLVDLRHGKWEIGENVLLWAPKAAVRRSSHLADIFAFLHFGQPGAILLRDGDILMSHWFAEDGVYKTAATRIRLL